MLATVTLGGGNPYVRRSVKDRFERQLRIRRTFPPGRYSFVASRTGYLEQNFDQPNPFARYRLLELAEGEQLDGMDFRLHRGAVITGVITDEAGDPLPDVWVQVMREQFGPAGRSIIPEMPDTGANPHRRRRTISRVCASPRHVRGDGDSRALG